MCGVFPLKPPPPHPNIPKCNEIFTLYSSDEEDLRTEQLLLRDEWRNLFDQFDPEVCLIPILGSRGMFDPYSWIPRYVWSLFLDPEVCLIPILGSRGMFDPYSWIPRFVGSLFLDPKVCFDPYSSIPMYVWSIFLDSEIYWILILESRGSRHQSLFLDTDVM